ncbi:MAG: shikimate kinase [Phycisphaerae bacterium]|nr:shikimate kinase [Phycisphaerae bacterium]
MKFDDEKNIVLIGMCGVGKSTIGVLLAKAMGMHFLDTDIYIQARENKGLQQIIDKNGLEAFCRIEQNHILLINVKKAVIATGGSVVYGDAAMLHLAKSGVIVHLDLNFETIRTRVADLYTRGVVIEKGENLANLYRKRHPLYDKYAEITIDCNGKNHDRVVDEIIERLG